VSTSVTTHAPVSPARQIPLSHTQSFLRMFDQGDAAGPFGPRYNIVVGWRVAGRIDVDTLRQAMADVVARHDSLRASIVRADGVGYQTINPPSPPQLEVRDLPPDGSRSRDVRTEELLGDVEAGSYSAQKLPHLRAVLGRFDDNDGVLVLITHHTASDGWSMHLLIRDIAACYAARRGHAAPALPEVRPYQEYAEWQQASSAEAAVDVARDYWREKLRDAQILAIGTDRPRSANLAKFSPVYRFSISAELTSATLEFARALRSSPFMVLLAAYNVLLHKRTGSTDLVIPTLTSGRNDPQFQDTVGPFFNFVPLRTTIAGCKTFRGVVERTRTTCLEAYSYDIPFAQIMAEAPDVMRPLTEDSLAACAFQVWQFASVMYRELVGDLEYSEVRRRVLSQADGTDIPDGALLTLDIDPSGEIFGNIAYNSNLFDESSMVDLVAGYRQVLQNAVTGPDAPLSQI
jgi:condensation enzyme